MKKNPSEKTTVASSNQLSLQSVEGRHCLTKCYPSQEIYFHPVILTGIRDSKYDTCAIHPVPDNKAYEHKLLFTDKCKLEDNDIYKQPNELDSILSSFYFNPKDFLGSIYDLKSFNDVIFWTLEYDHLPFDTIKRVHNCAWIVYGNNIAELTHNVMEYYYDICKNYWLKDYIVVIEKNYSFDLTRSGTDSEIHNSETEISSIILKFLTYEFFVEKIHNCVYEYQDKWNMITSHYSFIKKYIYNQIIKYLRKK